MKISRTEKHIVVESEYNWYFVKLARNLGGVWDEKKKTWTFDIRDEADVLEACYLFYGDDGIRRNLCDVKMTLPTGWERIEKAIRFFGRTIARGSMYNDSARVSPGIVIKAGGFYGYNTRRSWSTMAEAGTTIILRDVSRPLVEACIADNRYDDAVIEILPDARESSRATLIAERNALMERIREIDSLLGDSHV